MIKDSLIRLIKILVVLSVILGLAAFALPKFVNLNQYSQKIINKIEERTGNKVAIKGKISLSIFPQIKITFPNVYVYTGDADNTVNIGEIKKAIVTMSIYRFLWGDRNPDRIEIQDAKLNRDARSDSVDNLLTIVNEVKLKSFIVKDSLSYSQSNPEQPQHTKVNLIMNFGDKGSVEFSGSFFKDNRKFNMEGDFGGNKVNSLQSLNLNIRSADIDFIFQGNAKQVEVDSLERLVTFDVDRTWEIDGSVKIKMKSSIRLVKSLASVIPFLSDMEQDSLKQPIEISGNVSYMNGFMDAKDIKIISEHTNGSGSLSFSQDDFSNMKLKFDFDNIDVNQFLSFSKKKEFLVSENEVFVDISDLTEDNNSYLNFDILNQKDIDLKLTAKKIAIQKVALEDFNFNYNVKDKVIDGGILEFDIRNNELNSKFLISNFKFDKIAGTTVLLGKFSNNGNNINKTLELFNLRDYINIKEDNLTYSVGSEIIFAPKEISIFGIIGSIGETGEISGSIATKRDIINDYRVNLKLRNLKLVNFDLPLFESRLASLLKDSDDDRYLSKFIWFRTLDSTYDITFSFENTELKNHKIDDLTVLCRLAPSNMSIRGKIQSDFAESNFSLDLTSFSIKPSLAIKVLGKKLNYDVLDSLLFSYLRTSDSEVKQSDNKIWSDKPINPFSIYKYAAKFDIGLKSLKVGEQDFKDFKFTARTAGDSLYVDNLEMGVYGGKIQTRGNISFFRQILCQFLFSGFDLEVKDLLSNISPKLDVFQGPISLSGSVVVGGETIKELVGSLNISSNFVSSNISMNGIDSDEIVDIALKRKELDKDKVLDLVETSLNKGVTQLLSLEGNIKSDKGIIQSNNITFKTRFTSAINAIYFDLNNMLLSSNSQFLFLPYNDSNPISYNVLISGNLEEDLQRKVEDDKLIKYIKSEYDIVTAEDIIEQRRRDRLMLRQRSNVIGSTNDKNYLYYKLQEEIRVKKEEAEEAAELKKLNESKISGK